MLLLSSNGKVNPGAHILIPNNTVNINKCSVYTLTYVAFDGTGEYIVKNRKVTVKALTDNKSVLDVNTSASGIYLVDYSITDSTGNNISKTVNFYVM